MLISSYAVYPLKCLLGLHLLAHYYSVTINMCCACRIHENPLGDEGIEELVAGLLGLHRSTTPVVPDTMSENESTIAHEPRPAANSRSSNHSSGDNAVSQTPGKDDVFALKSLEIGACGITTAGARAVAKLIRANIGITCLSLTGNKEVEADGWAEIAESLEHNTVINTLELHHNGLENTSTGLIADALARNTSVHTVDLEGNHIGDEGAEKIHKLLEVNGTLQTIHLRSGNQISESVLAEIEYMTAERRHSSNAT